MDGLLVFLLGCGFAGGWIALSKLLLRASHVKAAVQGVLASMVGMGLVGVVLVLLLDPEANASTVLANGLAGGIWRGLFCGFSVALVYSVISFNLRLFRQLRHGPKD